MATNLYALIEARPKHRNFGKPFYIGIGTEKRPYEHMKLARTQKGHRNQRLHKILIGHSVRGIEPTVSILGTFDTKAEAGNAEKLAIAYYGREGIDGGILCNLACGGQGPDAALMQLPEIRHRVAEGQKRRSPESKARSLAGLQKARTDPECLARRAKSSSKASKKAWANPEIRARRVAAFKGVKKTTTEKSTAARQANARVPRSEEALAAQKAAADRNWADPAFREQRSASQAAAWEDPEKRQRMLEGRGEAIAEAWKKPGRREKQSASAKAAIKAKWENDPEYAEKARAGLRAAWADPEKKAARVAKMLASRAANGTNRSPESRAKQAEVMRKVNASISAEERSAKQTETWTNPEMRERRTAGLRAAAQDPALKAARIAAMQEGKRKKAALKQAEAAVMDDAG